MVIEVSPHLPARVTVARIQDSEVPIGVVRLKLKLQLAPQYHCSYTARTRCISSL